MQSKSGQTDDFRLGEWLVQPSSNRLTGPSGEVPLEPRVMELLVFLAANAGRVVSRQEIVDAVWRLEFVSDATLSNAIARLRRALGDDAGDPRYVETIPKRGYRLAAAVARGSESPLPGSSPAAGRCACGWSSDRPVTSP